MPDGAPRVGLGRLGAVALLPLLLVACDRPNPAESFAPGPPVPVLEHILDLRFMDAPELPTLSAVIASRVRGEGFAVAASANPSVILMFDGEGRFTGPLSRRGMGPGEISSVRDIVFDHVDQLWIFGNGRVDIWNQSLNESRTIAIPIAVTSAAAAPQGGTIVVGTDPNDIRVRVRHLSDDGALVPLEIEGGAFLRGDPGAEHRSVAPVDESSAWVAMFHTYEMRRLDRRSGDTIQRIEDDPEWWEVGGDLRDFAGIMDQSPAILSLSVGPDGTLWTVSGIPTPDAGAVSALYEGDSSAITRLVDHVIRVHDGQSGLLLCEHHAEYLPLQFLPGDRAAAVYPDGDSISISVFSLRPCAGTYSDR